MAVRKQRATTSELYALETEYKKCLTKAKRIHREDMEFYIYQINSCYCSASISDYMMAQEQHNNEPTLEYWFFNPDIAKWKKASKR